MKSLMDRIRESGRVFVFGIAGDSGSGKTTISRGIKRILGEEMVASFSMDDYHSLDRRQRKSGNYATAPRRQPPRSAGGSPGRLAPR